MMINIKNPFGLRNNNIITVYDLNPDTERGLRCNCVCPLCRGEFEAKMGDVREWHFAHSGEPCDRTKQFVNSVFLLTQQILLDEKQMNYPGYKQNGHHVFDSGIIGINNLEIMYRADGMAEAIVLNGNKLALRIALDIDYCVGGVVHEVEDMSTLLIDLTSISGLDTEGFRKRICKTLNNKTWIYCKRAAKTNYSRSMVATVDEVFDEEIDEHNESKIIKTKEYKARMVKCSICNKRVIKEDAMWGRNTRHFYCHSCIESKGLDWRKL